jgi:tetratricopeptide (TPR) repeat protein
MERKQRTFPRFIRPKSIRPEFVCPRLRCARTLALAAAAALGLGLMAGCHGESVNDYLSAGDAAMQNTQLPQAEQNYQAAVRAAPDDPRVHVALGNLYVFEQKPTLAQPEFMRVLELQPGNAAAHSALGGLYESEAQMGAAEEQYRAAVALKPADPAYRLQLGSLLAKANKPGWAETELRTAIGLQPKNARAHLALANLLNATPNGKTEADAEYAEVRALDPHLLAAPTPVAVEPATPAAVAPPPPSAPSAAPSAEAAVAPPSAPAVKTSKLKQLDRKFRLTKNSAVYQGADSSTSVVGQVHRGHFVHVTGIQGDWLQVTLRNGTVGFIPVAAAE